jgi:hypothetical protein
MIVGAQDAEPNGGSALPREPANESVRDEHERRDARPTYPTRIRGSKAA